MPMKTRLLTFSPARLLGEEDLAGDFARVEVAGEAVEAGGAELAAVGAADLGGDAEGAAVGRLAVEGGEAGMRTHST